MATAKPAPVTEQTIEEWFRKHFCNRGPLFEVQSFNAAQDAKDELKSILFPATTSPSPQE